MREDSVKRTESLQRDGLLPETQEQAFLSHGKRLPQLGRRLSDRERA